MRMSIREKITERIRVAQVKESPTTYQPINNQPTSRIPWSLRAKITPKQDTETYS